MLRAAIEMINQTGLTVSLDYISFEEVIRSADVARSTAYRHWPYKDLFVSDLITELARTAGPTIIRDEIRLIRQILAAHPDWLDTPETRHGLLLELIRQLSLLDLQAVLASPGWRTYLALHATFSSLADGEVREQVQTALAQAEAVHTARVAQAWGQLAGLFGYRLRPELATTFDTLATLVGATMRGLVITALSNPDIASHATLASPFGAASKDEWSLAAFGIASIAMALLEPDPTAQWDEQRLAEIHRVLDAWDAEDT
jgi:AcrR family transcriptional regulator